MNQSSISSLTNTLLYVNKVPLSGWLNVRCVTIMSLDKWNAIYDELIKYRVNGSEYIGQLHITR